MLKDLYKGNGLPDPHVDAGFYDGVPAKRLIAFVIDFVIILGLSICVWMIFGIMTLGIGLLLAPAIGFWTSVGYRIVTLAGKSATLGMRVMGIEFRTAAGDRFDFTHAAIHSVLFSFLFPTVIGQIISIITMLATPHGRAVPDLVLGSTAINRPE